MAKFAKLRPWNGESIERESYEEYVFAPSLEKVEPHIKKIVLNMVRKDVEETKEELRREALRLIELEEEYASIPKNIRFNGVIDGSK